MLFSITSHVSAQSDGGSSFEIRVAGSNSSPIENVNLILLNGEIIKTTDADGMAEIPLFYEGKKIILNHISFVSETIKLLKNVLQYSIVLETDNTLLDLVDVYSKKSNLKASKFLDFLPVEKKKMLLVYKDSILYYDIKSRRVVSKKDNKEKYQKTLTDCNGNLYLSSDSKCTRFSMKFDSVCYAESYTNRLFQEKIAPCASKINDTLFLIKRTAQEGYGITYHLYRKERNTSLKLLSLLDTSAYQNFTSYRNEVAMLRNFSVPKSAATSPAELRRANLLEEKSSFLKNIVYKPIICGECVNKKGGEIGVLNFTNRRSYIGTLHQLNRIDFLKDYFKDSDKIIFVGCINGNFLVIKNSLLEYKLLEINMEEQIVQKEMRITKPLNDKVKLDENVVFFMTQRDRQLSSIYFEWR